MKPLLCLDFDGVIHSYASGWKGVTIIPDPPVPGALQFLRDAQQHFTVAIHSSRSHQPGGIAAMQLWLEHWLDQKWRRDIAKTIFDAIQWPDHKPSAMLTIDDRAITFKGIWPHPAQLMEFKPWYKENRNG